MKNFTGINDVSDLSGLIRSALTIKKDPDGLGQMGKGRSICLIFFNPSLRTRLSSERAASKLGMDAVFLDIGEQGWNLEFQDGTQMNADKAEHIREAAAVIGTYYDMIGIRAFAELKDRKRDYEQQILNAFVEHSGVPVINLESPAAHPLQSLADLITIEEHKKADRPKVVLTWAPHPRALPQAVANSFVRWTRAADYDLTITHPEGYELDPGITGNTRIEYDQNKAYEGADFVYAKNWSAYGKYGQILTEDPSRMVDAAKMKLTNNAAFMHCLPVRRNVVVSDEVIDSKQSLVIPQAQNRVISMMTVLKQLLEI